ncbi:hemerythrin domain-containing protein [Candidatus Nitrospira bockiana]
MTARPPGPVSQYLAADHRRLDGLLIRAFTPEGAVDQAAYDGFRSGLLRHIGMEEKLLVPAIQRTSGEPYGQAARLRLDHGALAALLMPSPKPGIVTMIRTILASHNELEEGPHGLYEAADRLPAAEVEALLARLHEVPDVNVLPPADTPAVAKTVRRALERAGCSVPPDLL